MKFYMNVVREHGLVAVCDEDLIEKKIMWKDVEIKIKKKFYGKNLVSLKKAIEELKNSKVANLMGRRIVGEAIKAKLIEKDNVLDLNGVLHAQIVRV